MMEFIPKPYKKFRRSSTKAPLRDIKSRDASRATYLLHHMPFNTNIRTDVINSTKYLNIMFTVLKFLPKSTGSHAFSTKLVFQTRKFNRLVFLIFLYKFVNTIFHKLKTIIYFLYQANNRLLKDSTHRWLS